MYIQELWFLRSARRPMLINIYKKFHEDLKRFSSYKADMILWRTDRRMDRQMTMAKTICLPTLNRGCNIGLFLWSICPKYICWGQRWRHFGNFHGNVLGKNRKYVCSVRIFMPPSARCEGIIQCLRKIGRIFKSFLKLMCLFCNGHWQPVWSGFQSTWRGDNQNYCLVNTLNYCAVTCFLSEM